METVPYLIDNPEVGYVQARWTFANPDESYLTKAQEISLNFHCKCEQFVHFANGSFFNFNGTAGPFYLAVPINNPAVTRHAHPNWAFIQVRIACDPWAVPPIAGPCAGALRCAKEGVLTWRVACSGAGVWRRKTILTVGGWKSRTTVEDMDLSLRTYVNGWKAIYLANTTCINEVRTCTHACMHATMPPPSLAQSYSGPVSINHLPTSLG